MATRNLPKIDERVTIFMIAHVVGDVDEIQNSVLLEIFLDKFYIFKSRKVHITPFVKLPKLIQILLTIESLLTNL